jgi:hypothetical protein
MMWETLRQTKEVGWTKTSAENRRVTIHETWDVLSGGMVETTR